jgi:hypothetical protein
MRTKDTELVITRFVNCIFKRSKKFYSFNTSNFRILPMEESSTIHEVSGVAARENPSVRDQFTSTEDHHREEIAFLRERANLEYLTNGTVELPVCVDGQLKTSFKRIKSSLHSLRINMFEQSSILVGKIIKFFDGCVAFSTDKLKVYFLAFVLTWMLVVFEYILRFLIAILK